VIGRVALAANGLKTVAEAVDRLQAMQLACEQGALLWELRIALSLARARLKQGRPRDAKNILAPVHDRFREKFATADMQAASALLDSLPERLS
jgi:predicted ATPase